MDKEKNSSRLGVSTAAAGLCTALAGMYTLLDAHKVLQKAPGALGTIIHATASTSVSVTGGNKEQLGKEEQGGRGDGDGKGGGERFTSHHQRPSLSCWLGSTARVHGSHPMDTYPISCSLLIGTFCTSTQPLLSFALALTLLVWWSC